MRNLGFSQFFHLRNFGTKTRTIRSSLDEPLISEDEKYTLSKNSSTSQDTSISERLYPASILIFHGLILIIYTTTFLALGFSLIGKSERECTKKLSTWCMFPECVDKASVANENSAPAIEAVQYETVTFQGRFNSSSNFRGPPSKDIDAAWDSVTMGKHNAILCEYKR
jgi:hypothetical protein